MNDAKVYRALAARTQDKPDIQFAMKEICWAMAKPMGGGLGKDQKTWAIPTRNSENSV